MGNLPNARTETAIAGAAISHNLMNEIQDVLVAMNSKTRPIALFSNAPSAGGIFASAIQISPGASWVCQIQVPVGERITAVRVRVIDNVSGAATARARVYSSTDGVASAALATTNTSNGSGTEQTIQATGLSIDAASLSTYHITIDVAAGANSCIIHAAEYDALVAH